MHRGWFHLLLIWGFGFAQVGAASEPIRYDREIKPLLKERCAYCHGALKQEAGLRVDTASLLRQGGDSGSIVAPGKPDESLLIDRISEPDESLRMPPEGAPLKPEEIEKLKRWIAEGMDAPHDEQPEKDPKDHWSFQPVRRPEVPPSKLPGWNSNPIDPFIAQHLERAGLLPNPEADKATLLRRVTIDLIGLPPTEGELQAFLADDSPDAYEQVVDRLLSSPHYGERWGRHWMDVWRYSDWYGRRTVPDVMNSYPQIWRWRDWIVRSLNEDKGYDRMVMEMIAADEICPTEEENLVATGFIVRNWFKWNYNSWMKDQVEHTSKAFLGLTLNCCQCHDHKYDPLTQRDYFQLRAIFEPLELRQDRVAGEVDPGPFKKYIYGQAYGPISTGMVSVFDEKLDAQTFIYLKGDERNLVKDQPIPPGIPALLSSIPFEVQPVTLPPTAHYPGLKSYVREEELRKLGSAIPQAEIVARDATAKWNDQRDILQAAVDATKQKLSSGNDLSTTGGTSPNVIHGTQSLHLTSMGGRQVLGNSLSSIEDLRSVTEMTCRVRIIQDGHFNLQLAGNFSTGSTAAWISFQKGKLITFNQAYQEIEIGKYDVSSLPRDFRVILTPDRAKNLTRIQVFDSADASIPIADAEGSFGNCGAGPRDTQGIWLDIKDSGEAVLDDLQFNGNSGPLLTFDFESQELGLGVSLIGQDGWKNSVFSAGTTHVEVASRIESLPEVQVARQEYRSALLNQTAASLDYRLAEATLALARANLNSLKQRIAADDQRFRKTDEAFNLDVIGRDGIAVEAEQGAKFAAAQLALLQAEREVVTAELAHLAPSAQPNDQLAKAHAKCEAARDSLKSVQSADLQETKYTPLSPQYPPTSTGRRAALARWLVHEDQPLTPRVAVNHIWMRHFGQGLVETPFDFGLRGKAPSHPELLDWLASELRENHWDMKHLHRLMVTSRTYRSSSRPTDGPASNLISDKENHLFWRYNSYRVEAEVVRDSVLACTGLLDPTLGGHEIEQNLGLEVPRRSLYFAHHGETIMRFLALFDPANPVDCYERQTSVQPQQALAQANSTLTIGASRALAGSLYAELKLQNIPQENFQTVLVSSLFRRILNRLPSEAETTIAVEFLNSQKELFQTSLASEVAAESVEAAAPTEVNKTDTKTGIGLEKLPPSSDPEIRAVENLIHALFNHNDFFTVR